MSVYGNPVWIPRIAQDPLYLTFSSEGGEFALGTADSAKHWDGTLEYSTDAETWTVWDGTGPLSSSGGLLYLRGSGNTKITGNNPSTNHRWTIVPDAQNAVSVTGNIECLLDWETVEAGQHPTMAAGCFGQMFCGCAWLVSAPKLPARTLADACYANMFYDCTRLASAPRRLPATTLADFCYDHMFYNCRSLTAAPELPATTLAEYCYGDMFYGCRSLTAAPELPATTLAKDCYGGMFGLCTSLVSAPALPAATLTSGCYTSMFQYCTSLVSLPVLPAVTLPDYCYYHMFNLCSSLKLSRTPDTVYAYRYRIPAVGSGSVGDDSLTDMFSGTGGTFTGTPAINIPYYTDHEPVAGAGEKQERMNGARGKTREEPGILTGQTEAKHE